MADKIKGITIEFGGNTQKLQSAIKDVNKESKSLNLQLQKVDKALKFSPNSIELITQKQELMSKRVEANSKRVEDLKKIQEELSVQGINEQSDAWKQVSLEIETANAALQKATKAQEEFNFKVSSLGKAADSFGKIGGKLQSSGSALKGISAAAAGAIAGLGALAVKGAANADELITNAKVTHLTIEELQRLTYATELLDVSQETVFKSLKKLTQTMGTAADGGKAQKKLFEQLGVSITDSDGKLKTSKQTFDEVIDALGKVENATERDALAMSIFGKSAADLNPLIEQGSDAINKLSAGAVNIVPDESIQKIGEFDDALQEMKADGKAVVAEFGGALAADLVPLMKEFGQVVKNVAKEFGQMSPGMRKAIVIILLVVAALAPLLIGMGKLFTAIQSIINFLPILSKGFTAIASGLSFPVIAIAALVAMFIYAYTTSEDFRNEIAEHIESVKRIFGDFVAFFKSIMEGDFIGSFQNLGNIIKDIFNLIPQLIVSFIDVIQIAVGAFIGWIGDKIGIDLLTPFNAFMDFIKSIFQINIIQVFTDIIGFIANVFVTGWQAAWEGLGNIIENVFNGVLTFVKNIVNSIIDFVNGMIGGLNKIKLPKFLGGFGINIPMIPKLAIGTDKVLSDGLAYLHKGEQVVPSKVVSGGYTGGTLTPEAIIQAMKEANFVIETNVDIDGREVAERVSYIQGIELKRQGG